MSEIRVLVVDEDRDVLDLTQTFLEREDEGLDVRTEESSLDAIDRVTTEDIDCVVSDLRMPDLDGLELHERLGEHANVPFFLFTAAADETTSRRIDDSGVDGVVQKGTGTDHYTELAERIRAAVESARE